MLEAMAMGVPVIATSVGGNTELIKHRETGLLIKPENVDSLVKSIDELMNNPSLAKRLALKAREHVVNLYNWDKVIMEYIKLYEGTTH